MPSLKDIRKRIVSVKNTQKITRAMKLVAAAKLRRAQQAIVAARPYAGALERVVAELTSGAETAGHPLMVDRDGTKAEIVLLTSDRGLAGAYNAQIIKRVESFVEYELTSYTDVSLRAVGRKGNDYFRRRSANILSHDAAPISPTASELAHSLANRIIDDFLEKRVDRVYVIYNEFKSAISQGVVVKQLLPVVPQTLATGENEPAVPDDFIFEPSKPELLSHLVPLYVEFGLYRAALESIASEFGARMTAMDNATRNAGEMIESLSLKYNRARQAAITKELLEIIAGAESLHG